MTIGCSVRHWRRCWRRWPETAWYSMRWCCRAICRDCCGWSIDHPDLQFVLDHCAKPQLATGEIADWQRDIASLAERPNIVCKLSGLVTEAAPDWQIADLRQAVDHVLACFGPQRLLWGSDWPVVNLAGGYEKWFAAAETLLADLSAGRKGRRFSAATRRASISPAGDGM